MTALFIDKSKQSAVAILLLMLLTACSDTLSGLSGAGEMRIDVQVYRGPLSKDPWTQLGELSGIIEEAQTSLIGALVSGVFISNEDGCYKKPNDLPKNINSLLLALAKKRDGLATTPPDDGQGAYKMLLNNVTAENGGLHCLIQAGVLADLSELHDADHGLQQFESSVVDGHLTELAIQTGAIADQTLRSALSRAATIATRLKVKALNWQTRLTIIQPDSVSTRAMVVGFAILAAEYANQIGSRADTLLLEMQKTDRRELPLSVYLRELSPTDFFNLVVWDHAAAPALLNEWLQNPVRAISNNENSDRVRVIERLYEDHNWSKINTAYASGRGDVSMAFIKDDIGNWNLKSFSSDPSQLLKAYTHVAEASLSEAAKLIQAGTTGGGAALAAQAYDFANRVSSGKTTFSNGITAGGLNAADLHDRANNRLMALKADMATQQAALEASLKDAKDASTKLGGAPQDSDSADAKKAKQDALDKVAALQKQRDALPKLAVDQATAAIHEHSYVIDVLLQGAAPAGSAAPAPTSNAPQLRPPQGLGRL